MKQLLQKIKEKGALYRTATIKRESVDEEERTVKIAFSSEDPYERWFGMEILGHKDGEVNMSFMGSGSAPFLDSHNSGKQIGVIEKAWIDDDKKGRALVRFSKNVAADEVYKDILDGIRKNISVGYEVNSMVLISESKDEGNSYRVNGWTPLEASSVSIPADMTVGVGRGHLPEIKPEVIKMELTAEEKAAKKAEEKARLVQIQNDTRAQELHRIKEITALGNHKAGDFKVEAEKAIADGTSIEDFRSVILAKMDAEPQKPVVDLDPTIGMGPKEVKQFSFLKLIRAMSTGDWRDAGFEKECSQAFEDKSGRKAQGMFVPGDMFKAGNFINEDHARILAPGSQRDLVSNVGSQGGYLVAEQLMTSSFIDLLRNTAKVMVAGARTLNDLQGDIDIPKQTGGATAYWVGEASDITESQQALGQIRMAPKTVGCLTDITRRMMIQSSMSVEAFVRMDFAIQMALAIDAKAINGSGAGGEPLGIINTSDVGSVTLGAASVPTWANIVALETAVNTDNALTGALSYMTNATINGNMKVTERGTVTQGFILENGSTNGYQVHSTGQIPAKYILFGNWADLIMAFWSGLDVTIDKNTLSASGGTRVVAFQDLDIAVRHGESFAVGYKA